MQSCSYLNKWAKLFALFIYLFLLLRPPERVKSFISKTLCVYVCVCVCVCVHVCVCVWYLVLTLWSCKILKYSIMDESRRKQTFWLSVPLSLDTSCSPQFILDPVIWGSLKFTLLCKLQALAFLLNWCKQNWRGI